MIFNKVSKSVILKDMLLKKGKFNFGNLVGTDALFSMKCKFDFYRFHTERSK